MSSARIVMFAIQGLQALVLAKLLGPSGFGEMSLFGIILLYGSLTGFGIDTVAAREIPGRLATGDVGRCQALTDLAFTHEIGLRLAVSGILTLGGLVFYEGTLRVGILLVAAVLVFDKVQGLCYSLGSARKEFEILSRGNMITAGLLALLTVALVRFFGIYTQLMALLGTEVCMAVFYLKKLRLGPRLRLDRREFVALLKMGLPFTALSCVYYVWRASDRTVIAAFLDVKTLGIYSFATLAVQMVVTVMNDFQTAFQPFIYERTVKAHSRHDFFALVNKPSVLFAYVTPGIIACLWVVYPVLIGAFMPEYRETIWPFRILLGHVYLVNVGIMVTYLLRSPEVNKQSWLVWCYALAAAVSYLLMAALVKAGFGVVGVALGVVLGHLAAVLVKFGLAHALYLDGWRRAVRYYLDLLSPLPGLAAFCLITYGMEEKALLHGLWKGVALSGVLLLFAGGLLYIVDQKIGIVTELLGMAGTLRRRGA